MLILGINDINQAASLICFNFMHTYCYKIVTKSTCIRCYYVIMNDIKHLD